MTSIEPRIVEFILSIPFIVFIVWKIYKRQKTRRKELQKVASTLRMSFKEKDRTFPFPPFHLLKGGLVRVEIGDPIHHLLHGVYRGREVALFEQETKNVTTFTQGWYSVAAFRIEGPPLPKFTLRPRAQDASIRELIKGWKEIDVPSTSQFKSTYVLSGSDETAIRHLFCGKTLDFFARNRIGAYKGTQTGYWSTESTNLSHQNKYRNFSSRQVSLQRPLPEEIQ